MKRFFRLLAVMSLMGFSGCNKSEPAKSTVKISTEPGDAELYAGDTMQSLHVSALEAGKDFTITGLGIRMVWIKPGSFTMGSPSSEEGRRDSETQRRVTLSKGYWLAAHETTQEQWKMVLGKNPAYFAASGKTAPVEQVSWEDCQGFIASLNNLSKALPSGYRFALPTEAQWEYACRAGTTTPFHYGSRLTSDMANFFGKSPYGTTTKGEYRVKTLPVGSFKPNAWGLYDMHGNVLEWCGDWYGDYPSGSVTDPTGAASGSSRVFRGGCWSSYARGCRSALRLRSSPGFRNNRLGFRLACRSEAP